ncbi:MAG TPA: 2-dehydropantoate 2-reductase [Hyphomicrobiaceae bacterium]|nr:2-dehydropantoate 2-reductase [Hyphomicrobiaceae bacterium]
MAHPASEPSRSAVAVVGLGSIGGVVAGCLADTGRHEVIACVRRPLERLTVERPEGTVEVAIQALTDPQTATPVDWVLLATKVPDTAAAGAWLRRLCRPSTRVAVLQNGIDHVARVAPFADGATVIPIMVYFNGERLAPDRVRIRHVGDTPDMEAPDDDGGQAFARLFEGSSLSVRLLADFKTQAWRKLLVNAVANPMTCLTLRRQEVLRHPDIHALSLAVLQEAAAVARADGARIADDEPERTMAKLMMFGPELGTSMYFDRVAGRPLEADALTGAIVAAGERLGVPTPLNAALLALLRAVSEAAQGPAG